MLVPKKNRQAVYQYLFQEGVLVAKHDFALPKHPEIDVPNLQVIKLCQSLTSRGFLTKQFSWMYNYYYLTDEGIEHLREYLHLPVEIVPNTLKKPTRPQRLPADRDTPRGGGRFGDREGGREGGYRRGGEEGKDKSGPDGRFQPSFGGRGGGFGRGQRTAE